ncbi:hypothetical protein PF008_g31235 [Phytophthora fragariae]|uniref:Secreted protein n=1 Tax=Phytophthora fragariae TaxID=53985 RepID=A0A6G0Q389_9STRA|nr:hypothetical protein PF008_g31235 [Phytophthora fragariae]
MRPFSLIPLSTYTVILLPIRAVSGGGWGYFSNTRVFEVYFIASRAVIGCSHTGASSTTCCKNDEHCAASHSTIYKLRRMHPTVSPYNNRQKCAQVSLTEKTSYWCRSHFSSRGKVYASPGHMWPVG